MRLKGAGLDVAGLRDISAAGREIIMFECWVYKEEPHLRLVVKQGAMLPTELGHKDWTLLGPWQADAETTQEVEHRGFHFFKTAKPYDDASLKNAEASGN